MATSPSDQASVIESEVWCRQGIGHGVTEHIWTRPSLADGAIGIACLAVGMAVPRYLEPSISPGVMVRLFYGVTFGGNIAGPMILGLQFFRGRRATFSAGEYFWTFSIIFSVFALAIDSLSTPPALFLALFLACFLLCLPLQGFLSLFAWVMLVMSLRGLRPLTPCRWSDGLGCLVCGLTGPFLFCIHINRLSEV